MTSTQSKGDVEGAALMVSDAAHRIEAAIAKLAETVAVQTATRPAPAPTVAEPMKVAFRIVELYAEGVLGADEAMRVVARELGFPLPPTRSQHRRLEVLRAMDSMPAPPAAMVASEPVPRNALHRLPSEPHVVSEPEPEEEEDDGTSVDASSPALAQALGEQAAGRSPQKFPRSGRSSLAGSKAKVGESNWTVDDYQKRRIAMGLTWRDLSEKAGLSYHTVMGIARGQNVALDIQERVQAVLRKK